MEIAGQLSAAESAKPPMAWRRFDFRWVIIGLCVAVVAYLALIPLGFLMWQSFFTPQTANKTAEFTFNNFRSAYTSVETLRLLLNSLQFALGTAGFAFVTGATLAWTGRPGPW